MVDHIVALHDRMIGVQNIDFKIEIMKYSFFGIKPLDLEYQ